MSLKLKCIAALAFIVELFVLSSTAQLNIERGYRDTFDNPNCDSLTQNACNCDNLNAHCVDSVNSTCKRCRCSPAYATFLSSNGKSGKCVKNRHLLFIPGKSLDSSWKPHLVVWQFQVKWHSPSNYKASGLACKWLNFRINVVVQYCV